MVLAELVFDVPFPFTGSLLAILASLVLPATHHALQSRQELLSPEGLRLDGRRPNELRRMQCRVGGVRGADGSAFVAMGNTHVLVSVYGPRQVSGRAKAVADGSSASAVGGDDSAVLRCTYRMAPFASAERKRPHKRDRRAAEINLLLRQTFEPVVQRDSYKRSQIDITVTVIQADGGTRCAAINGCTLALMDAGIAMNDFVCACAAGLVEGVPILDLNYAEDSAPGPDIPIALLPRTGKVSMLQMDSRVTMDDFERVVALAMEGCKSVHHHLQEAVKRRALHLCWSAGRLGSEVEHVQEH